MEMAWFLILAAGTVAVGYYAKRLGYPPHWFVFLSFMLSPVVPALLLLWLGPDKE